MKAKECFIKQEHKAAFERCINILAELIEKYAGEVMARDGKDLCYMTLGEKVVTAVILLCLNREDHMGDFQKRMKRYVQKFKIIAKKQIDTVSRKRYNCVKK